MEEKNITKSIKQGKIFIYPTDTLYGIGCDAENKEAVEKIREIKGRDNKPFSIIAPSFEWIEENLILDVDLKKYLPGPYTIILKKKNPSFMNWISNNNTLEVRIPKHPFTKEIQKAQTPFVTTSVNFSGQPSALSLKDIPEEIKSQVDVIIESKITLLGKPSTLIVDGKPIERK